jgi:PhnB protein
MPFEPNLVFAGHAEEVLEHYRSALGGELTIVRFAGSPAAQYAPPGWGDKVLYGTLASPLGNIHAMDASPERAGQPGGNIGLSIATSTEAQTDAIFAALSAGGNVLMPLEKTFWSPKFGMFTDKFGTRWMISLAPAA